MTATAADADRVRADAGVRTRLAAALPLATIFAWLALVYAWQAWLVTTPIIFTDELQYTLLARSLAEVGAPQVRGEPQPLDSLAAAVRAPAWLLPDLDAAYLAAKLVGVLAMTAAIFPAYGLARLVVSRRLALVAAAGSVLVPGMAYAALLMEEPIAYLASTTALYVFARTLAAPTRRLVALAVALALVAPLVRGQLVVLPGVLVLAALVVALGGEHGTRVRARMTPPRWAAAVALALAVAVALHLAAWFVSPAWRLLVGEQRDELVRYGLAALGAFALGLGVVPLVAGLAALLDRARRPSPRASRAFVAVALASLLGFAGYTTAKIAYLSASPYFAPFIVERNLLYLAPVLFAATALWLERPAVRAGAVVAAGLLAALALAAMPLILRYDYFEAPGYSLLVAAHHELGVSETTLARVLPALVALAVLLVLLPRALARRPRARGVALAAVMALVLAWNAAGEVYAGVRERERAQGLLATFPEASPWVDRVTGGSDAIFLGHEVRDPNRVHLLEFWNRSLAGVWTLDTTGPGPGVFHVPRIASADGTLDLQPPGVRWIVAGPGIEVDGNVAATAGAYRLYRIGEVLRLRSLVTGVDLDGWMGHHSTYSRFDRPPRGPGVLDVTTSRIAWGGWDVPADVIVRVGRLTLDLPGRQPVMGTVLDERSWRAHSTEEASFRLPAPPLPLRVEVTVQPTFVPAQLGRGSSDFRELGVQVDYRFLPGRSPLALTRASAAVPDACGRIAGCRANATASGG